MPRSRARCNLALYHVAPMRIAMLALVGCLAIAGCSGQRTVADSERSEVIYVVRRGWHTGIALSAADWPQRQSPLLAAFADARYLEFGWGDAAFYQADKPTVWMALAAVLWPSATVMEVAPLQAPPPAGAEDYESVAVHVSNAELQAIAASLDASFAHPINATGKTYRTAGGEARFYDARGNFHLFRMCNRWTAEVLEHAGCVVSPRLAMTAGQVIRAAKKCATEAAGGDS
jgi:uncharacterized protein (TIGR02117 family)